VILRAVAPAKINWSLRVVGRLPNGYHELDSVFQALALADELTLETGEGGDRLTVRLAETGADAPELATPENLVLKAAATLRQAVQPLGLSCPPVRFHLTKAIPWQAGLGGGSSDAATALRLLAHHWGVALRWSQWLEIGFSLGADVPFFLCETPQRISGVGLPSGALDLPEVALLLLHPGPGLSTPEVFRRRAAMGVERAGGNFLTPCGRIHRLPALFREGVQGGALGEILAEGNDLGPAALDLSPELRGLVDWAQTEGMEPIFMSGSGPTCFVPVVDDAQGRAWADRAQLAGWRSWSTRTLRQHPGPALPVV